MNATTNTDGTTSPVTGTMTARVAVFVCSDWQGPSVIPSHSAYTSQVAENLGLTMHQASAALRRAEQLSLVYGSRGAPGEETYWMPPGETA